MDAREKLAKALASDKRIKIIDVLRKQKAMDLEQLSKKLGVPKQQILYHLKKLTSANVVNIEYVKGLRGAKIVAKLKSTKINIKI